MHGRNKWISVILVFVMLFSTSGMAMAAEPVESGGQYIMTAEIEETALINESQVIGGIDPVGGTDQTKAVEPVAQSDEIELTGLDDQIAVASENVDIPTSYSEVYERMNAFRTKEGYTEGTTWTNFTPYGSDGSYGDSYVWKGGSVFGANRGVGCAAFAFILSDAAFGSLPARVSTSFTFADVRVGDILRVNGNSHSVIVLQKSASGVIIAEANYNKSVHWGRAMSVSEVEAADYIITRYPANFSSSDDAAADTVEASGKIDSLTWTLTKAGVLTISGNGAMPDYTSGSTEAWKSYNASINTIVIEKGVTSIGNYAFCESNALSVYIAEGVTSIGKNAFSETKLMSVTIPGTVESIKANAFYECPNLMSATVSEGVKTIGEKAFYGCMELQYIDFPSSITSIGAGAFMDCKNITRVRFMPSNHTVEMGDNLFMECWNLRSVTLPEKADRISGGMFYGCMFLPYLYIPAGVTEICGVGAEAGASFQGCSKLLTIDFGGTEEEWGRKGGASALQYSHLTGITVNYSVPFDNPFSAEENDPGDLIVDHEHNWSAGWESDQDYHWHACGAANCWITANSEKDGYGAHSYGAWVIDAAATVSQDGSRHRDCTVCGYRQTESIPATDSVGDSDKTDSIGDSDKTDSADGTENTGDNGNQTAAKDPVITSDDWRLTSGRVANKYNVIVLNWNAVHGGKYEVWYSATPEDENSYKRVASTSKTTYKFTKAALEVRYGFKIRVKGTNTVSETLYVTNSMEGRVEAPAVQTTVKSYNSVQVKWSKVAGVKRYAIYRDGIKIAEKTSASYTDKGLTTGETYVYTVRPIMMKGAKGTFEGPLSAGATAVPTMKAVSGMSVKAVDSTRLKVKWGRVKGASYYTLYKMVGDELVVVEGAEHLTQTQFIDSNLLPGAEYSYQVVAYGGKGYVRSAMKAGRTKVLKQ